MVGCWFRIAQWMQTFRFVVGMGCVCGGCRVGVWGQVLGLLVPVSSNLLPGFHSRPINPVVYLGALTLNGVGYLISKRASRLDAFSGYPFRT